MKRYLAGKSLELTCELLNLNLQEILSKSGIEMGSLDIETRQFSPREIGRFYTTLIDEYPRDDLHIRAAKGLVGHLYGTGELAFLVSRTVGDALHRLAKMKAWIKPVIWKVSETAETLELRLASSDPAFPCYGLYEISSFIYTVEALRFHTKQNISARTIQITSEVPYQAQIAEELGCEIHLSDKNVLVLDASIKQIPIRNCQPFLTERIDQEISLQISEEIEPSSLFQNQVAEQIKNLLMSNLSSQLLADKFCLSKRTFERRLANEGTSFRQLLDQVRSEMAITYLNSPGYTLTEVSYLLGFKEPNSLIRAFKRWHGCSISEFIQSKQHSN